MIPLLEVQSLSIGIKKKDKIFKVVRDISFEIQTGEIVGIVGESGCGKTLTARSILALPSHNVEIIEGNIIFNGSDIYKLSQEELNNIRGKEVTMIFQEPFEALNPLIKVGKQIGESIALHQRKDKKFIYNKTLEVMRNVGLQEAEKIALMYPHELSGGMRQRAMIALAIISKPKLLIADEPTTALDLVTQNQILFLLKKINKELGTAILFISHDLEVVNRICSRVIVMYAGKIVEEGDSKSVFSNPMHEYTKGLLGSMPSIEQKGKTLLNISGIVPSIEQIEKLSGCPFAPRCFNAEKLCFENFPEKVIFQNNHKAYCIKNKC